MTGGDTKRDGIDQWLGQTGFPLEFEALETFRQQGFTVRPGVRFEAWATGQMRETDIVATESRAPDAIQIVAECKFSPRAWIIRADRAVPELEDRVGLLRLHRDTHAALARYFGEHREVPFILQPGTVIGHGISAGPKQAKLTSDDMRQIDEPYEALQAVADAVESLVRGRSVYEGHSFVLGVIVLEGRLELLVGDAFGQPSRRTKKWQRVRFRAAAEAPEMAIDVVTKAGLPEYLHQLRADTMWLAGLMERSPGGGIATVDIWS